MTIAVILHVIGTVLGAGGVTMNDLALLRAVGDGEQGVAYQKSAKIYSLVIWVGLVLLIATAIYFAVQNAWVMRSDKVLLKILIVALLTINGIMMNRFLTPVLEKLKKEDWEKRSEKLKDIVVAGIFPGALSITSWYAALILGAAGKQDWTANQMTLWFVVALGICWVGASIVVHWKLQNK